LANLYHPFMKTRRHFICAALCGTILALGGCGAFTLPDPDVHYIAFGDSTTDGPSDRDYWDILRERLGEDPIRFANEGQGGESTEDGLQRLQSIIAFETYPNATTLLLWQGGNDIIQFIGETDSLLIFSPDSTDYPAAGRLTELLDDAQSNLEQQISAAQAAGWKVYVATLFPIRVQTSSCDPLPLNILLAPQAANANVYVRRLNDRIGLAAENTDATLVDIESRSDEINASGENYFDCNHLSAAGNAIAADEFLKAFEANAAEE
jgi:lysophospholipase L1-like esterase